MRYFLFILLFWVSQSFAQNWDDFENFSKLLHYQNNKSLVVSKDFFMHKNGNTDILSEINALKQGYFKPTSLADKHPRCIFPDRYFWLSKQIKLKNYEVYPKFCKKLTKWSLDNPTKSISILLVGGYFSNPASVFGHNLLKLNSGKDSLFDLTLNFGARIPKNENTISYILKGLFGGYSAVFSSGYFYKKDLVYSKHELRDIWEYKLNLNNNEKTLIKLHIWSIQNKKFDYYFLKENCAYQIASILDIVMDMNLPQYRPWYIPNEIASQLYAQNNRIKRIDYKPSFEKNMLNRFKKLTPQEALLAKKIIKKNSDFLIKTANTRTLDALLEYYKYKAIDTNSIEFLNKKYKIILARLKKPVQKYNNTTSNNPAPHKYPKLSKLELSFDSDNNLYGEFSIFNNSFLGKHNLLNSELITPRIQFVRNNNNIFFHSFDLLKVKKLNKNITNFPEYKFSWEAQVGLSRIDNRIKPTAIAGIGGNVYTNDNNEIYIFNSLLLNHSQSEISPQISINLINNYFGKSLFKYGIDIKNGAHFYKYKIQKQINNNISIFFEKNNINSSLGVGFYF
ncbi:hypothetical protein THERMOT_378 [Bathymodiolus thermophilus thioautotrophic gill symbiont]|uniref:DUF4105 domain-containing protein n=2 Tax=Bathymodiolus thermophilus thioautotrophic gill symbiont TaxID=2360 RepID=A0A8H8XEQ1_9GAMM|nr:hypothetical protein THERMOT_378 [Bathymodiolus thermophilus thioautotrophic gill symbiont]CAB5505193.1 hypothetical protein THERMOS_2083 [Bathymodiolus thermophilus thioautotrophic gill symbiont]